MVNITKETFIKALNEGRVLVKSLGCVGTGEYEEPVEAFNVFVMVWNSNNMWFPRQIVLNGEHQFEYDGGGYNKALQCVEDIAREIDKECVDVLNNNQNSFNVI